jgi:hypothetical protein
MSDQLTPWQLVEVLRVDRRERWRKGERILAETYFEKHPDLAADPACAVELLYHEVLLREELGETPEVEEYLKRFPQWIPQLGPLFEVHRAVEHGHVADKLTLIASPTPVSAISEPRAGPDLPHVNGYEILACIGRGGMGVVYKARQLGLNQPVALKMILGGTHADSRERARFRSEAEAQARLQHPNIVQIHEVGETSTGPYFALELVEGESLDKQIKAKPQPARAAAQRIEVLARAMHYAHQRGLIHRDLKPANVLVTADGELKITDFGLAKQLQSENGQTKTGDILGTPSYMAPEQASEHRQPIGPAADIYALGAIFYEMLAGRPPFLGETPLDTLIQLRYHEPIAPRRLQPKVPRDLETICIKSLHKNPAKRYASAAALADDLGRFLDGQPIRARPVRWWERGIKWAKRSPAIVATAGTALILAIVTWTVSTVLIVREKSRAEENLGPAGDGRDRVGRPGEALTASVRPWTRASRVVTARSRVL